MLKKILILLLVFILFPQVVIGATIYQQDFNSLSTADLDGQDSWADVSTASYSVQESVIQEGAKAVSSPAVSGGQIERVITSTETGLWTFYYRTNDSTNESYITIRKSNDDNIGGVIFDRDGDIYIYGSAQTFYGTYSVDTWYKVDIEWDYVGQGRYLRIRIDDGTWSSWLATVSGDWLEVAIISLADGGTGSGFRYFDNFLITSTTSTPPVATDFTNAIMNSVPSTTASTTDFYFTDYFLDMINAQNQLVIFLFMVIAFLLAVSYFTNLFT